jgi:hypothetical protein
MLRSREFCPQLDYALAVPGHKEKLKILRYGIKSSGPSLSRSWKLSTVQITQQDKVVVKYLTWDTHGFRDIRTPSYRKFCVFMSFWHFLQSKHVLRERLLTGLGLQTGECAQVPVSFVIWMSASARSMKDGSIP